MFSYEALDQATATYKKLKNRIAGIPDEGTVDDKAVKEWHDKFAETVGNDVNTAMGLTLVYDVLKSELNGATKRAVINDFDYVLGLDLLKSAAAGDKDSQNVGEHAGEDPAFVEHVEEKIAERAAAKKEKNFALADEIRAQLLAEGIVLEDTREGVKWHRQ